MYTYIDVCYKGVFGYTIVLTYGEDRITRLDTSDVMYAECVFYDFTYSIDLLEAINNFNKELHWWFMMCYKEETVRLNFQTRIEVDKIEDSVKMVLSVMKNGFLNDDAPYYNLFKSVLNCKTPIDAC